MAKVSGGSNRLRSPAAQAFSETWAANLERDERHSCRLCNCTELQGCPEGCYWTADRLCSACTPSMEETITALCLVGGTTHITDTTVMRWSMDQRADAYHWAVSLHYHASNNPSVTVPPRPEWTLP